MDFFALVVVVQQLLNGVSESLQQYSRRHLSASVDSYVKNVLVVKLKIQPGTPVRDYAGRIEYLAARVCFTLVVVEKNTRRTM
jgi:hypothetical protein